MKSQVETLKITFALLTLFVFVLSCNVSNPSPNNSQAFDPTKVALELQNTAVALQLTQASVPTQPPAQPVPTEPPIPVSTPEATVPQVPAEVQEWVDKYYEKGYLAAPQGEYHRLDDFSMDFANASMTFAKKETGYTAKDFAVRAHFKWQSAITYPDPGGCGWSFRRMKSDSYLMFVDREWTYMGLWKDNTWTRYGRTTGEGWVGLGNPAEADVALVVSKGKAYILIDDVLASSHTLDTDYLTGPGELDYAVVAGTYKDFGTRCEMTNVDLWIANP